MLLGAFFSSVIMRNDVFRFILVVMIITFISDILGPIRLNVFSPIPIHHTDRRACNWAIPGKSY